MAAARGTGSSTPARASSSRSCERGGSLALDVVALSHPHPDHLNGLFRILQRFPVGAFWSSGDDGHNPEYRRLVALAAARGVPTPEVTPRALGGARVEPLGPFLDGAIAPRPG